MRKHKAEDYNRKYITEDEKDYDPRDYAAIYVRKSGTADTLALQTQIDESKDFIFNRYNTNNSNKLLVYGIYADEQSATEHGKKYDKRKGFADLLKDARLGRFKTVISYRRDRLSRDAKQALEIKGVFKSLGISLKYSAKGEYQPDDGYMSNFIDNVLMAVDQLEPNTISIRSKEGTRNKREKGYWHNNKSFFGYKKVNKDEFTIEESEAAIVQRIFDWYMPVKEKTFTASMLSQAKHNNKDKPDLNNLLTNFDAQSKAFYKLYEPNVKDEKEHNCEKTIDMDRLRKKVFNVIQNPKYAGMQFKETKSKLQDLYIFENKKVVGINKDLLMDCHKSIEQPIISEKQWFNAILKFGMLHFKFPSKEKRPITENGYIFKGLIRCNNCGKNLLKENNRYKCKKGCINISEAKLLEIIYHNVIEKILDPHSSTFERAISNVTRQYDHNYVSKVSQLKKKRSAITDLFIAYMKNQKKATKDLLEVAIAQENDLIKEVHEVYTIRNRVKSIKHKISDFRRLVNEQGFYSYLRSNEQDLNDLLKDIIEKVNLVGERKKERIYSIEL
ncbi:MAG: Resolvase, N-terminal domain [Clostridiales bacterium]|nr:Resolvase, N-terminal domain [Clostridiales bacterium]